MAGMFIPFHSAVRYPHPYGVVPYPNDHPRHNDIIEWFRPWPRLCPLLLPLPRHHHHQQLQLHHRQRHQQLHHQRLLPMRLNESEAG